MKRRGGNGAPPSILIDLSAGPESGESADVAGGLVWSIPLEPNENVASVGGRLVRVDHGRLSGLAPSAS